jgi:glucose-1-phosphate cytidylyltransferase
MKVGILAGGLGSRLSEETDIRPKPMVEIGGMPILWHIMQIYAHYGLSEFCIALGYKGEYIKRWFRDLHDQSGSINVSTRSGAVASHTLPSIPDWSVDLIETGRNAGTGGRIRRLAPFLGDETALVCQRRSKSRPCGGVKPGHGVTCRGEWREGVARRPLPPALA